MLFLGVFITEALPVGGPVLVVVVEGGGLDEIGLDDDGGLGGVVVFEVAGAGAFAG
jgi:hypothetical protein